LSGCLYQLGGLSLCLWGSAIFLLVVVVISTALPKAALPKAAVFKAD
jgi:hypothetical protein